MERSTKGEARGDEGGSDRVSGGGMAGGGKYERALYMVNARSELCGWGVDVAPVLVGAGVVCGVAEAERSGRGVSVAPVVRSAWPKRSVKRGPIALPWRSAPVADGGGCVWTAAGTRCRRSGFRRRTGRPLLGCEAGGLVRAAPRRRLEPEPLTKGRTAWERLDEG